MKLRDFLIPIIHPELGTLEWINFNPDFLIRISTVETFHFSPYSTLFLSPWISVNCFLQWEYFCSLIGCPLFSDWLLQFLRRLNINLNFIVFHTLLR